ncbi:MAG: stage III sporulation protein AE [Hyphomonadaceae bacterium]|nr:stage III sporulation protein AE [Clostridia bacterium]
MRVLFIAIFAFFLLTGTGYAEEITDLQNRITASVPHEAQALMGDFFSSASFEQRKVGQLSFNLPFFFDKLLNLFATEVAGTLWYLIQFIVIAMLTGFLMQLQNAFHQEDVSKVAFFVGYALLAGVGIKAVLVPINAISHTVDSMITLMQGMVPVFLGLMVAGGNVTAASVFQPTILFAVQIVGVAIKNFIVPVMVCTLALTAAQHMSGEVQTGQIVKFIQKGIKNLLMTVLTIFTAFITIQGFAAAAVDGVMGKTAKFAVDKFVPVVGGILSGAADTVMGCSLLVKNAMGISGMVALCVIALLPIVKICAIIFIFRLTAALIQPMTEQRLVDCLDGFADVLTTAFAVLLSVMFLFLITCTMLLATTNATMMFR